MRNLRIGSKFVLSLGILATVLVFCGLWGMQRSVMHSGLWMIGIIAVFLLAVYWLMHLFVLKPLHTLAAIFHDIAHGEGDLTKRVPVGSGSDEITDLARDFNLFIKKMHGAVYLVNQASNR